MCSRCHYDIRHIKEKFGYLLSDLGENKATTIAGVRVCYWGEDGAALSEASNLQMDELKERRKTVEDKRAFVATSWRTLSKFVVFIDTFVEDPKGRYLAMTFQFPRNMDLDSFPEAAKHPHSGILIKLLTYMALVFKFNPLSPHKLVVGKREEP